MRKPEPATGPSRAVPASAAKSKAAPTTHAGPSSGTSSKVPLNTKASIKLKVPPKELPQSEPEEPYEELPSIASEYSDSDDDTQSKKTAALPNWAQSPALKAQLIAQSRIDPDDVFGAIPDLKLEGASLHV